MPLKYNPLTGDWNMYKEPDVALNATKKNSQFVNNTGKTVDVIDDNTISKRLFRTFSDFQNALSTDAGVTATGGTGAAISISLFPNLLDYDSRQGCLSFGTGTTTTGFSQIGTFFFATQPFIFTSASYAFETSIYIPTLSDALQAYNLKIGFLNNRTPTSGIYFSYDQNNANWVCFTANNNAPIGTNSNLAVVAGTWLKLRIEVIAGTAFFFVNDIQVAAVANNLPNGFLAGCGDGICITKTAGTTSRNILADYKLVDKIINR